MQYEREDHLLNEPLTPQIGAMLKGCAGMLALYLLAAVVILLTKRRGEMDIFMALMAVFVIAFGVLLLMWWMTKRERLIIDASGVRTRSLTGKTCALEWQQIHTAAVVRLSRNELHYWIVLSTETDPAQVLARKHLTRKPQKGTELRIPYGVKRRVVIEQQLHMKLPEFFL